MYLVAKSHKIVCHDESFEDNHPAGIVDSGRHHVHQYGNLTVGVIGELDQVCRRKGRDEVVVEGEPKIGRGACNHR